MNKAERVPGQFPPADFEQWFAAIEAGDGSIPVPQSAEDGDAWHEYVGRRQIALGAWLAATKLALADRSSSTALEVKDLADRVDNLLVPYSDSEMSEDKDAIVSALRTLAQQFASTNPIEARSKPKEGLALAKARDAWMDSDEARMLANDHNGPVGGQYLRNRLEVAFCAGYSVALQEGES